MNILEILLKLNKKMEEFIEKTDIEKKIRKVMKALTVNWKQRMKSQTNNRRVQGKQLNNNFITPDTKSVRIVEKINEKLESTKNSFQRKFIELGKKFVKKGQTLENKIKYTKEQIGNEIFCNNQLTSRNPN